MADKSHPPAADKKQKQQQQPKSDKPKVEVPVIKKLADLPLPDFVQHRLKVFAEVKAKQQAEAVHKPIKIKLPDGAVKDGEAFKTTPFDIAMGISKGLAENAVGAKVNGQSWDLNRPFEEDSALELVKFDSDEGKKIFWHSSAHILGQALEFKYSGRLCTGPPLVEGGFYYDVALPEGVAQISMDDYAHIQAIVDAVVNDKQPFERLILTKQQALEMFKYNKYKVELIGSKVPDGATCTAYKCGPLIDLCKGPHIPNTNRVKGFAVTKNSSSYWKGDAKNDSLNRVYGISFPDKKQLKEWQTLQEEAAKRDHRVVGKAQDLLMFHSLLSPGSAFFLPKGARIYNKLIDFLRGEYRKRGFTEVISPNIFNKDLWEVSGHWANYKEHMFIFDVEGSQFSLKPMNCPGHCLMFQNSARSYKELPLRFADFGVLHRNEFSGALSGLTRVRRFQQDDAHIFCPPDQIGAEINNAIAFMKDVYGIFGFEFELNLSTRPEKFLGDVATWDKAEAALKEALTANFGDKWNLNPGDGAFYGPKIDVKLTDALRRKHQCATLQLDFQLPRRFGLSFRDHNDQEVVPVIIHRALFGSLERFIGVLIEHTGGKWPFWLSPRQAIVVTVSEKFNDYARQIKDQLWAAGFDCEFDTSDNTLQKKVRDAQVSQFNFILVVGQQEVDKQTVNVRTRDNQVHGERKIEELIAEFHQLVKEHK